MAGIRIGVALACLSVALLAAGCGGGGALGPGRLAQQSDAVRSLAAEGALLAGDGADGRTTATFTREHGSFLAKAAAKAARALRKARTRPGLEPELRTLRRLSAQVRDQLEGLDGASQAQERGIAAALGKAADDAGKISARLA